MADLTRFDFHVSRFVNSEDVERMTAEEVGQYLLLLCKSWLLEKEATLPDDARYLATQARSKQVSPLVMKKFPLVDTEEGPRRRNPILYGEWLLAKDRQNSYSERGKKGNEARYSDNNSENVATAQVTATPRPIPLHSTPFHSKPNQTTNSIQFSGGSFSQGNFKFISGRWYGHFKKTLQKSKQNKEQYAQACSTYGEDRILEYLETWATDNQWVAAHPKGGNRLYVFLQTLPEMVEGDQFRADREKEETKNEIPKAEIEQIMAANSSARDVEIQKELKRIADEKQFLEETKDLI